MAASKNTKTLEGWKTNKRHSITLSSGFEVDVEIPNLPQLVKSGQLPNDLVAEALTSVQAGRLTPEMIVQQADFYNKLVAITVKEPAITEEDVPDLPFEDVELIVELATRQRDVDAIGHHLGGLEKSSEWRQFRGLDDFNPALAGL